MKKAMMRQLRNVLYTFLCILFLSGNETVAYATTDAVYASDVEHGEDKVYRGVINTDELNVRKAAGKNNPLVQADGKGVTLNKNDEVAILDKTLSSKETWYKVSFRRGDSLIVGYVHGSYVDLTKDVITPLPVSPSNSSSASSNPVSSSNSSSASSNQATNSQTEESDTNIVLWISFGIVFVITALALLILYIRDKISDHSHSNSYSSTSYGSSSSSSSGNGYSSSSNTSYSSSSSSSSGSDYSGSSSTSYYGFLQKEFNAASYIYENELDSYLSSIVSVRDKEKVENDPALTPEQKREVITLLRLRAMDYD